MDLYRAMSVSEAISTLKTGKPVFNTRFKWFTPNIEFIHNRVKDGKFANSAFKSEPYSIILKFTVIKGFDYFRQLNYNELILDRRDLPMIIFGEIHDTI